VTHTRRFVGQLAVVSAAALAVSAFPVWRLFGDRALAGLLAGAAVSTLNCGVGFYFLRYALGRSPQLETAAVLGGFFGRLVVAVSILFACRAIPSIDQTAMGLSIVAFYFLGMTLEVRFLFKHVLSLRPSLAVKEASRRVAG
jgi:hypothetical protein